VVDFCNVISGFADLSLQDTEVTLQLVITYWFEGSYCKDFMKGGAEHFLLSQGSLIKWTWSRAVSDHGAVGWYMCSDLGSLVYMRDCPCTRAAFLGILFFLCGWPQQSNVNGFWFYL
jgi:hypothetical protein